MNTTNTLQPRFDLYAAIHKALRLVMAETLTRLGSLDAADAGQRHEAIMLLRTLLDMCRAHVEKENRYVHPAIEARCAGLSERIAVEHVQHLVAINALEADAVALQCAPEAASAFRLYRRVARFVAENLAHMDDEETVHNAALWASYRDEELLQVHRAILSSIAPDEMAQTLNWLLPALNNDERTALLGGLRDAAPATAFDGALQVARRRLVASEWAKLECALLPQALAA